MKVNWDDYSQYMGKMFQTTNQIPIGKTNNNRVEWWNDSG